MTRRLAGAWVLSVGSLLGLWTVVAAFFPPTLLPPPTAVARRLAQLIVVGGRYFSAKML